MHRIDTLGHVGYMFDDGTPPADGTICDDEWLNAVQEELCKFIEAYGQTLVKGTYTQLQDAMKVHARDNPVVYTASGSNGLYSITTSPPITSYTEGMKFIFRANHANLYEVAKLNVDSVGSVDIRGTYGWKLIADAIGPTSIVEVVYHSGMASFVLLGDHADQELYAARGSTEALADRIDKALSPEGYVSAVGIEGGNCLVQHWCHWDAGGAVAYKTYNMIITKFGGPGQYSIVFPPATPFTGANDYMMIFSTNAGPSSVTYGIQVSSRTTTTCTITTYKDGVATNMDADHYIAFIGTKHT